MSSLEEFAVRLNMVLRRICDVVKCEFLVPSVMRWAAVLDIAGCSIRCGFSETF